MKDEERGSKGLMDNRETLKTGKEDKEAGHTGIK